MDVHRYGPDIVIYFKFIIFITLSNVVLFFLGLISTISFMSDQGANSVAKATLGEGRVVSFHSHEITCQLHNAVFFHQSINHFCFGVTGSSFDVSSGFFVSQYTNKQREAWRASSVLAIIASFLFAYVFSPHPPPATFPPSIRLEFEPKHILNRAEPSFFIAMMTLLPLICVHVSALLGIGTLAQHATFVTLMTAVKISLKPIFEYLPILVIFVALYP
jgi:hypothetical protein